MNNKKATANVSRLTVSMANHLLETMPRNRRVSLRHVTRLTECILRDQWRVNGESVVIDWDGNLRDGQHRCHAVVAANKAIETVIVRNIDPSAYDTLDIGRRRKAADVLHIDGESETNLLAASLSIVWRNDQGKLNDSGVAMPPYDAVETFRRHAGLQKSLQIASLWQKDVGHGSIGAAVHYIVRQAHPALADRFFKQVGKGVGLTETMPSFRLRSILLKNRASSRKLARQSVLAFVIKAVNAEIEGREIGVLRYSPGGNRPEPFPAITP